MKVLSVISRTYNDIHPLYKLLGKEVDRIILTIKSPQWHYASRVKELKSYALKLETGRFDVPERLEDFFACTLVVENKKDIKNAIVLLKKHFTISYRRPYADKYTHKKPESFEFDDLRLYLKLNPGPTLPKGPIHDLVFEMQIKTFLQHAWSVATHDLIYKTDEIYWARHRVAYQVRALLENAEVSIDKASGVKRLNGIPEENKSFKKTTKILDLINSSFSSDQLPKDKIRLAQNLDILLASLDLSIDQLRRALNQETAIGRGTHTKNLSPYMVIVQSLIFRQKTRIKSFIKSGPKNDVKHKILITKDVDLDGIRNVKNSEHIIYIE